MDEAVIRKYKMHELTPIEKHGGMYFKRDDLYTPFSDIPLSGGKVRQAIALIADNEAHIRDRCDGKIYTAGNMDSPQGIIVTRVAREFGFGSKVFIGGAKNSNILRNKMTMNILTQNGELDNSAVRAWPTLLESKIRQARQAGDRFFHVKFGINVDRNPDAILGTIAYQAQNLPRDLDNLIIPCGSFLNFCAIMQGLKTYGIRPKNVIGIQIYKVDHSAIIAKILRDGYPNYRILTSYDYNYHRKLKVTVDDDLTLDPVYEAKAYDYVMRHMRDEVRGTKTLFWIVGNSWKVRLKTYYMK